MRAFLLKKRYILYMKPLYISLNKKPSINYLRLIAGLVMVAGTVYLYVRPEPSPFYTYQLILLFLFGLYYTTIGAGINLLSFITKTYIETNEEYICAKQSVFAKKHKANWSEISEIQINITAIRVKLKSNDEFQFEYQFLDEETIHTLKVAIIHQAKNNAITLR